MTTATRFDKSRARISDAFAMKEGAETPIMVWPLHYIITGTAPEKVPTDLFDDLAALMAFQQRTCEEHLAKSDDDFIPYLIPYFGTGVLASAFGVGTSFAPGRDPAAGRPCVTTPAEVARLRRPVPEREGLAPPEDQAVGDDKPDVRAEGLAHLEVVRAKIEMNQDYERRDHEHLDDQPRPPRDRRAQERDDQRAEGGISDRIYSLCSISRDRHGCGQYPDGPRHADAFPHHYLVAV